MEITVTHLAAGISVLLGAIGTLWGLVVKQHKDTKTALEGEVQELREKRESDQQTVLTLTGEVGKMSGYRLGVEDLSAQVLSEVRSLKDEG